MPTVYFSKKGASYPRKIEIHQDEKLLDGLLRAGIQIPYSCKAGLCHSCLLQTNTKSIPKEAQRGLQAKQIARGMFLSCQCSPPDGFYCSEEKFREYHNRVRVLEKTPISEQIVKIRLERVFDYQPGQYCTLWRDESIARSYSIASHPQRDDYLEFHIKRIPDGAFSGWAWHELAPGDYLEVQGPMGECYYDADKNKGDLLLCGVGTGLAPLYGIARDALYQDHKGAIKLLLASKHAEGFYLLRHLKALREQFPNFDLQLIAQDGVPAGKQSTIPIVHGNIYEIVKDSDIHFASLNAFICGAATFVQKMRKILFLKGTPMANILADAFVASAP